MNKTKALSLVLVLVASTGFVFGSFGFTSVSAERGVSVQVVDDSNAFIGYQSSDLTVRDGERVGLVTVTNRFSGTISVTDVTIADGRFDISNPTTPAGISPGEEGTIRGTVQCTPGETQKIALTVTLDGNGVTAHLSGNTQTRAFTIRCAEPKPALGDARFFGAGNFQVNATNVETTEIVYWTADKKWTKDNVTFTNHTLGNFDPSQKLQSQTQRGTPHVVAVYFPEFDVTYVHPNYYDGKWGAGEAIRVEGEYHPDEGDPCKGEQSAASCS